MVALDDVGAGLSMRRFDLEAVARELVHRDCVESGAQCFEIQLAVPQRLIRGRIDQQKLRLEAKMEAIPVHSEVAFALSVRQAAANEDPRSFAGARVQSDGVTV